jgi:hypothetical protein
MAGRKSNMLRFFAAALCAVVLAQVVHAQQPGKITPPTKAPAPPPMKTPLPAPQAPASPLDYLYTAETNEPAKKQGLLKVGTLSWGCQATRCVAKSTSPAPDIAGCRALGEQVGHIKSYGHPGRQLTAPELEQCNVGIAIGSAPGMTPPLIRPPVASAPAPMKPGSRSITTGELSMTGLRFQSKEVTTGELAMTGLRFQAKEVTTGELIMTGLRFQPKSVTTGELSMTGVR